MHLTYTSAYIRVRTRRDAWHSIADRVVEAGRLCGSQDRATVHVCVHVDYNRDRACGSVDGDGDVV